MPAIKRAAGAASKSVVRDGIDVDRVDENLVTLSGRVTREPQTRELPSGDQVTSVIISVRRPAQLRTSGRRRASSDALTCVAWTSALRRKFGSLVVGDEVQVEGALRRRVWRTPTGIAVITEVEVTSSRRTARATMAG